MTREIQLFQVGIKAFITYQGKLLMLQENSSAKLWELPGGRIDIGEESLPPRQILLREIHEELGLEFKVEVGRPCATWTRIRPGLPHIFLVGIECSYTSGDISPSGEHLSYRWVTQQESHNLPLAEGYRAALDQFWKNS